MYMKLPLPVSFPGPAVLLFASLLFTSACHSDEQPQTNRPHEPWVVRCVLDSFPRIAAVALHDELWIAYHTETGALYKAWKGSVNFDGAVYTTVHGPQPSSVGDDWFVNHHKRPWRVMMSGQEIEPKVQYRGHRFENGQVWFNYELTLPEGQKIRISERPEYFSENGLTGLERTFRTEGVPEGAKVVLLVNLSSLAFEKSVHSDCEWETISAQPRRRKHLYGYDIEGRLTLPSNGTCQLRTLFTRLPLLENENKIAGDESAENLPLGLRLIDRSDCKTCHNTFVATVGPSYLDVARRYRNTTDNVNALVAKVKTGGSGNWGQAAMTPHADLPDNDIRLMVEYIMSLDAEEEAKMAAIPETKEPLEMQEGLPEVDETEFLPGAVVRVYQYDRNLTQLADLKPFPKPVFEGVVPALHATAEEFGELTDNFGLVAEGYLKIPKDNNYLLRLVSDDGSKLWLDGELLIDHDGLHGDSPKDAEIGLKAGFHPFRLEYFEAGGGNVVSLQWRSFDDNGSFEIVPPAAIWHKKDETPSASVAVSLGGGTRLPGDRTAVDGVHPSYDLAQARPDDFFPKVGGMDFLSDGRLVVSRWDPEGGVYIIDGVQTGDPAKMTAKRIAAGLHEPLGLKVVDDTIYVLQKQELTKLIDLDGDEVIDEYYTLCNSWGVSTNFHEFAFGLVYKDGYFYGSLATDILPGGAGAPVQPKDRGRTFKISRADGSIQLITSGLRTPNGIGIGVDGEIFNADNQGDWLPASKIVHITEGAFYGSRAVDFEGTANLPVKQPVVWLPQDEIGNSPSTPLALNDGPYKGQMIHCEVTHGGVKRVFVEKVNGEYQGCVFRFIQGLGGRHQPHGVGPRQRPLRGWHRQPRQLAARPKPLVRPAAVEIQRQARLRDAGCQGQKQRHGDRIHPTPGTPRRLGPCRVHRSAMALRAHCRLRRSQSRSDPPARALGQRQPRPPQGLPRNTGSESRPCGVHPHPQSLDQRQRAATLEHRGLVHPQRHSRRKPRHRIAEAELPAQHPHGRGKGCRLAPALRRQIADRLAQLQQANHRQGLDHRRQRHPPQRPQKPAGWLAGGRWRRHPLRRSFRKLRAAPRVENRPLRQQWHHLQHRRKRQIRIPLADRT
ncbi:MAG: hypothetical protein KatS3mg030_149 [Saprospiraceae bacterium]|nr:MAG: hypothetical protein KatS3mg030_149 [Saprospiraceae bacterium]